MSPSPNPLLGPPEARRPPPSTIATTTTDPFIDLLDSKFNPSTTPSKISPNQPPMGLTENCSPTFLSSGNPCLDFFFQVVPSTHSSTVVGLLSDAWRQDSLTALKLVCNLRGVRGTGKSDKEGFYSCALWLHSHHPKTLALNVAFFAEFGYMKDLLEILYRLLHGSDARGIAKSDRLDRKLGSKKPRNKKVDRNKTESTEDRIAAEFSKIKIESEKAGIERKKKRADLAIRAIDRYNRDPEFRFLHDRIAEFFANLLSSDLEHLKSNQLNKIGLAAKWCPSLDSSFDRSTLLCESIARRLFDRESNPEYLAIDDEHYAYRVRDRLRREVLVPLRKVLELPEVFIGAGKWDSLPYNRVASVAMKRYKKLFMKHDQERFSEYLSKVREGKAKIAAGALLPHQILDSVCDEEAGGVAELQWRRMVQDLLEIGRLKNCIAVCDVSGSMSGTPMEVCVALGLLISELSEEPWKGRVITFSESPQLHLIAGDSLKEKMEFVKSMDWGMNTDFQKVFDRMLDVAKEGNLAKDDMIKRVFVFSDMEFDQASANDWETDYEAICRKFREHGYESCVPEIVFWNLRDSRSTPVPSRQNGVAMVSGFSKNLVKLFLEGGGIISPVDVMESAIAGEEYQKLVVFD